MLKKNKRLGILGGTFDPPHLGHLHISKIALKKFRLDKLIWVITKQNPFKKKPFLDTKIRIGLSKNIIKNHKKISTKYFQKQIKSQNTYDLLKFIKKKDSKYDLFFLIGADNLINFHKWKNWKKIPQLAKVVVFARPSYTNKALKSVAAKKLEKKDWIYLNNKKMHISSSLIRNFW